MLASFVAAGIGANQAKACEKCKAAGIPMDEVRWDSLFPATLSPPIGCIPCSPGPSRRLLLITPVKPTPDETSFHAQSTSAYDAALRIAEHTRASVQIVSGLYFPTFKRNDPDDTKLASLADKLRNVIDKEQAEALAKQLRDLKAPLLRDQTIQTSHLQRLNQRLLEWITVQGTPSGGTIQIIDCSGLTEVDRVIVLRGINAASVLIRERLPTAGEFVKNLKELQPKPIHVAHVLNSYRDERIPTEELHKVFKKFLPHVFVHDGQRPISISGFLSLCGLNLKDGTRLPGGRNRYLELSGDWKQKSTQLASSPIVVYARLRDPASALEVDAAEPWRAIHSYWLQYFMLFPYNDASPPAEQPVKLIGGKNFDHQGDWISIDISLAGGECGGATKCNDLSLTGAVIHNHGRQFLLAAEQLQQEGNHVKIWLEKGTNEPTPRCGNDYASVRGVGLVTGAWPGEVLCWGSELNVIHPHDGKRLLEVKHVVDVISGSSCSVSDGGNQYASAACEAEVFRTYEGRWGKPIEDPSSDPPASPRYQSAMWNRKFGPPVQWPNIQEEWQCYLLTALAAIGLAGYAFVFLMALWCLAFPVGPAAFMALWTCVFCFNASMFGLSLSGDDGPGSGNAKVEGLESIPEGESSNWRVKYADRKFTVSHPNLEGPFELVLAAAPKTHCGKEVGDPTVFVAVLTDKTTLDKTTRVIGVVFTAPVNGNPHRLELRQDAPTLTDLDDSCPPPVPEPCACNNQLRGFAAGDPQAGSDQFMLCGRQLCQKGSYGQWTPICVLDAIIPEGMLFASKWDGSIILAADPNQSRWKQSLATGDVVWSPAPFDGETYNNRVWIRVGDNSLEPCALDSKRREWLASCLVNNAKSAPATTRAAIDGDTLWLWDGESLWRCPASSEPQRRPNSSCPSAAQREGR